MKSFIKPLPSNNNVKGSGVGSPPADVNKISEAIVEIRTAVPDSATDVNAVTASQLSTLTSRLNAAIARVNALKKPTLSDDFNRTTLGASWVADYGTAVIVNNAVSPSGATASIVNVNSPATSQMYATGIVNYPATGAFHPKVAINYSKNSSGTSYYSAAYSVSTGRWELNRRINGVSTLVASSTTEAPPASGYSLTISQYRGLVTISVNNSVKVTYNDGTPLTGKQIDLIFSWSSSVDDGQAINTITYGDI